MGSSSKHHVAVWLDHEEAKVFRFSPDGVEGLTLHAPNHHVKRHPDRNVAEKNHPEDVKRFFHELTVALGAEADVLVVGPSTAKLHFLKYVHAHDAKLDARIVGVETVDHPTDKQIVAYAREYFHPAGGRHAVPAGT